METPAVIQYLTGSLQVLPLPTHALSPEKVFFSFFISFSLCIYFLEFVIGHHSTIAWLIVPFTFCRCSTNSPVLSAVFFLSLLYSCTTFNPFPNKPWFSRVFSISLLKTLWEKEKLLVTSNFSFSHSVF